MIIEEEMLIKKMLMKNFLTYEVIEKENWYLINENLKKEGYQARF